MLHCNEYLLAGKFISTSTIIQLETNQICDFLAINRFLTIFYLNFLQLWILSAKRLSLGRIVFFLNSAINRQGKMRQAGNKPIPNWLRIILFLTLLYVFFTAIGLMGASFKLLGKDVAESLMSATSNPFTSLMIGILATSIVQSSSFTTSMVVGLVSGGVISIEGAVPIIMGANIGTSVTNLIVSFGHLGQNKEFERAFGGATIHDIFNFMTVAILLPLELATGILAKLGTGLAQLFAGSSALSFQSPLKLIVKPVIGAIKNLFLSVLDIDPVLAGSIMIGLSFLLLFLSLILIVKNMKAMMLDRLEVAIDRMFGSNPIFAIMVGMILTAIIQSSSITTSLLIPMIGAGAMSLEAAFPITIGANIGTTITALLASLAGDINGLAIAFVHLLFHLAGMLLVYPLKPIRNIPLRASRRLAKIAVADKRFAIGFVIGLFYALPLAAFGISQFFDW